MSSTRLSPAGRFALSVPSKGRQILSPRPQNLHMRTYSIHASAQRFRQQAFGCPLRTPAMKRRASRPIHPVLMRKRSAKVAPDGPSLRLTDRGIPQTKRSIAQCALKTSKLLNLCTVISSRPCTLVDAGMQNARGLKGHDTARRYFSGNPGFGIATWTFVFRTNMK